MSDTSCTHNIHGFIVETRPNGVRNIHWAYSPEEMKALRKLYSDIRRDQLKPTLHTLELWNRNGVIKRKLFLPAQE